MQTFNTWPDKAELNLPEVVSQATLNHLLEPFQTEAEAKAFWQENLMPPYESKLAIQYKVEW